MKLRAFTSFLLVMGLLVNLAACGGGEDPASPSVPESVPETAPATVPETEAATLPIASTQPQAVSYELYAQLLQDIHDNPNDYTDLMGGPGGIESDIFAICDIDGDGVEELIVCFLSTYMAAQHTTIWKPGADGDSMDEVVTLGAYAEYYSNGAVRNFASHNQSPGQTIWPYGLSVRDPETGSYNYIGSAYCVDEGSAEYDAALDEDGDGVLYYFTFAGAEEESAPITKEAYDALVNEYIPEERLLSPEFLEITQEHIDSLK